MIKLKHTLLLSILIILESSLASSQNIVQGVVVELSSGKKIEFKLSDKPILAFDGKAVILKSDLVEMTYSPLEISKVVVGKIDNTSSGISAKAINYSQVTMSEGFVHFTGFNKDDLLEVYSLSGVKVASYLFNNEGSLLIPSTMLPKGVNLINVNSQTFKIVIK